MEKNKKVGKQKCAIYTRVSTEEQANGSDFTSLDNQREYSENYIKSQESLGWQIYPERYDDSGYSGGNMERPGLRKLLFDAKKKKFNVILIYKIDRLTRNLHDFGKLWDIFEKYDISFVSVTQKFDTTTSMGRLMLHVLLSFSQFEREINSERTRDKMLASAKRGKWMCGNPPVGYDLNHDTKKLLVNKKETKQVEFMYKSYLKEKSALKASMIINARGYRTKARITLKGKHFGGHKFAKNSLKAHLKNPIYLGKIRYKGEIYEGEHPAIISESLFNQVMACIDRNGKRNASPYKNTTRHDFLLTGLIRCVYCGSRMTPGSAHSRGNTYLYYNCTKVAKHDRNACKYRRLPARELEKAIVARLKFLAKCPGLIDKMVKKAQTSADTELPELIEKLNTKIKRSTDVASAINNLKIYITERIKDKKNIDPLMEDREDLNKEKNELTPEINLLKIQIDELKSRIMNTEVVKANFKNFHKVFDNLDYNNKRELIALLIREIRYIGDKNRVELDIYQMPDINPFIDEKGICFAKGSVKGG